MSATPLQMTAPAAHYQLASPNPEAAQDQTPTAGYAPGQYRYSQA